MVLHAKSANRREFHRIKIQVYTTGFGSRITGSDEQPLTKGALADPPGQCMLPAPRPQQKDIHTKKNYACLGNVTVGIVQACNGAKIQCPIVNSYCICDQWQNQRLEINPYFGRYYPTKA
jgi:hypothetical protein